MAEGVDSRKIYEQPNATATSAHLFQPPILAVVPDDLECWRGFNTLLVSVSHSPRDALSPNGDVGALEAAASTELLILMGDFSQRVGNGDRPHFAWETLAAPNKHPG